MKKSDQVIFEAVLKAAGFDFGESEGLYAIRHPESGKGEEFVQTNGYNLLYSLQRLTNSTIAKDILR